MTTVSAVIINFDGERYLEGMMAALKALTYPLHEIIVVDDASRDGSRLWIRAHHPEVLVIAVARNAGPGHAREVGLRAASGAAVLFLDNDGHPEPDALAVLVRALESDLRLIAVMPRIVLVGDPPIVQCDGAWTHFTGQMILRNAYCAAEAADPSREDLDSLMGTAMFVRRAAALAAPGSSKAFFWGFEDGDFGVRLRLTGARLQSAPLARIRHLSGTEGLSLRSGRAYPWRRAYLIARNRWYFMLRTFSARSLVVLSPLILLHEFAQALFAWQRGWGEAWFQGLRWNLARLGRTLREREAIQAARRVSDHLILRGGPLPLHPGTMDRRRGLKARLLAALELLLNLGFRALKPWLVEPSRTRRKP